MARLLTAASLLLALVAAQAPAEFDIVLRNGTVYDGGGATGRTADVAITGDRIAAVGRVAGRGTAEIDVRGLAVAPGFVNMLSHSETALIEDGRSQGAIRQGVTLEVFGESSLGPLSPAMKEAALARQSDIRFDIPWTTLGE